VGISLADADIIPTGNLSTVNVLRFDAVLFAHPDHALLTQRPGHEIFGPGIARLALAAG